MLSRVVLVDVDVVQRGLLQAEDVDHGPVQDVVGLGEELVEAPTLLLIGLQDVGEHRGQEALKTPERPETTGRYSQLHGYNYHTVSIYCPYENQRGRQMLMFDFLPVYFILINYFFLHENTESFLLFKYTNYFSFRFIFTFYLNNSCCL